MVRLSEKVTRAIVYKRARFRFLLVSSFSSCAIISANDTPIGGCPLAGVTAAAVGGSCVCCCCSFSLIVLVNFDVGSSPLAGDGEMDGGDRVVVAVSNVEAVVIRSWSWLLWRSC